MKKATASALAAIVVLTLAALPGYGQTTQDVLNKMIEATGGRKALQAIKDTTISGTAEMVQFGMTANITIYQKEPNKVRYDIDISAAGMTIVQAYDGQKAWFTNPQTGATEEMPELQAKDFSRQALGNAALLDPAKLGITYALKPKAKIEDKDYIVLEQTLADGHKTTIYLDPATYLPYKSTTKSIDMSGAEIDAETFAGDYRKVDGTLVSFSMRILQNGAEFMRMTFSSVKYNSNIDDALFVMK